MSSTSPIPTTPPGMGERPDRTAARRTRPAIERGRPCLCARAVYTRAPRGCTVRFVSTVARSALDDFTALLGPDRVVSDEDGLRAYRDPYAFPDWDDYTASAVVLPETVEEVQEIVRIAGRHGVPLWPISQGRNNGYGGAPPPAGGAGVRSTGE